MTLPRHAATAAKLAKPLAYNPAWPPKDRPDARKSHEFPQPVKHQPSAVRDSFTDVVHFFYDDTTLAKHPDQWVGLIPRDASEADAVRALVSAMDLLFAKMRTEEPDEVYIRSADWPQVVMLARKLVAQLEQPDEPVTASNAVLRAK